jgi:hypothetical protein
MVFLRLFKELAKIIFSLGGTSFQRRGKDSYLRVGPIKQAQKWKAKVSLSTCEYGNLDSY